MATRTTTLALEIVSDLGSAATDLGAIESAATSAAAAIDKVDAATDGAASGIDRVSGAADGLDSTGGAATGALGALASGFELVGADKAAESLQKAALATDFLSGVGQAAALATQAQEAATKGMTAAQTALNAVMRANPMGVVLLVVVALAAAIAVAYAKSETFRDIVDRAGAVAKAAFDKVSDAVAVLVDWVSDRIPGAFSWFRDKAPNVVEVAVKAVDGIRDAVETAVDWVGRIPESFERAKDKAADVAYELTKPFRDLAGYVQNVIDKIASIRMPDVDLTPWNGRSQLAGAGGGGGYYGDTFANATPQMGTTGGIVINVTVQQTVGDPVAAAETIRGILARAERIGA
jgi:hypothetical protein